MRRTLILLVSSMAALAASCVERAPQMSPADRERVAEYISREAPEPAHPLDVRFDNGVQLLGYALEPDTLVPGQSFTLTLYWKAERDLDDGWMLFTHIADGRNEDRRNCDAPGQPCVQQAVVREVYQPGRWQAGEYVRDVIRGTLQEDWNNDRATVYVGLWNGPHRMRILRGPNDGNNRVRVASVPVTTAPGARAQPAREPEVPQTPPPSLEAAHATAAIAIDGRLDEADWSRARRTARFVDTVTGADASFAATARVLWDDDNLYVAFDVADDHLRSTLAERDAHLWEQDAVEIMVDPGGDGRNYFELQVSPTGQVFDTRYDTRRQPQPFGHVDWNAAVRAQVQLRGTANDATADEGYVAEVAIPWSAFATGEPPAARPEPNSSWRVAFYVMDARPEGQGQRSAGWSPTYQGDFHVPARFGQVTFAPAPEPVAQAPIAAPGTIPVAQPRLRITPDMLQPALRGAAGIPREALQPRPRPAQAPEQEPTP